MPSARFPLARENCVVPSTSGFSTGVPVCLLHGGTLPEVLMTLAPLLGLVVGKVAEVHGNDVLESLGASLALGQVCHRPVN